MPTVLITGANRGLGLEFARQYSGDGWRVIACCRTPGVCYASSKTALNRAMTIVADKLKDRGIIVAMFCPGYVKTDMDVWGHATVEIEESISALRPLIGRLTIENTASFSGHDGRTIGW